MSFIESIKPNLRPFIESEMVHNGPTVPMQHRDGEIELRTIVEAKAYDPRVIIKNECVPRPWEIENCTTCSHGTNLFSVIREQYFFWCAMDCKKHIGDKFADNVCGLGFKSKIKRPRKGYLEGIER
jgi:hypothetical protein